MSTIPKAFELMLEAWNETDPNRVRALADEALTEDVEFIDPTIALRGREAWVTMVLAFHKKSPGARVVRTSGIDQHHDRARYGWAVVFSDGRRFDGVDAVAVDQETGKLRRIDGFFGKLPDL
jgi:hypothetical protein